MNKASECSVCGGQEFSYRKVLWQELVSDWQQSPENSEGRLFLRDANTLTGTGPASMRSHDKAGARRYDYDIDRNYLTCKKVPVSKGG
jgi:hypothetical protein